MLKILHLTAVCTRLCNSTLVLINITICSHLRRKWILMLNFTSPRSLGREKIRRHVKLAKRFLTINNCYLLFLSVKQVYQKIRHICAYRVIWTYLIMNIQDILIEIFTLLFNKNDTKLHLKSEMDTNRWRKTFGKIQKLILKGMDRYLNKQVPQRKSLDFWHPGEIFIFFFRQKIQRHHVRKALPLTLSSCLRF